MSPLQSPEEPQEASTAAACPGWGASGEEMDALPSKGHTCVALHGPRVAASVKATKTQICLQASDCICLNDLQFCLHLHPHTQPHPNPRQVLEIPWSLLSVNIHSQGSEHVPCTRHFARCWDAVGSKTKPGSCPPGAHILAVVTGTNQSSPAHTHHHGGGTLGVLRVLPAPASLPTCYHPSGVEPCVLWHPMTAQTPRSLHQQGGWNTAAPPGLRDGAADRSPLHSASSSGGSPRTW